MHRQIPEELEILCEWKDVNLLYACESGSRAWDIASVNSDYDIRFIYYHPEDWYLSLEDRDEVIEHMDGLLDFAGWDIRKAFKLAHKSNPGLLEWLNSHIVYHTEPWVDELKDIMRNFSAKALMFHYTSLARTTSKQYLRADDPLVSVSLKKYLYAVRPLMAVEYMRQNSYALPPLRIQELLEQFSLPEAASTEMDNLLAVKKAGGEEQVGRYPALDSYISLAIDKDTGWAWDAAVAAPGAGPSKLLLENLFRRVVRGWV